MAIAAGDGAAEGVAVFEDGHGQAGGGAAHGVVTVEAFHDGPAVVLAAGAAGGLEVDFFVDVLADVADPEVAGLAVEGEAPRVAQAVRPDLPARGEGVARGDGIRRPVDVDAEDLAEELVEVLSAVGGGAGAAAVAAAGVEGGGR